MASGLPIINAMVQKKRATAKKIMPNTNGELIIR